MQCPKSHQGHAARLKTKGGDELSRSLGGRRQSNISREGQYGEGSGTS